MFDCMNNRQKLRLSYGKNQKLIRFLIVSKLETKNLTKTRARLFVFAIIFSVKCLEKLDTVVINAEFHVIHIRDNSTSSGYTCFSLSKIYFSCSHKG